jgi:hypothetical protein
MMAYNYRGTFGSRPLVDFNPLAVVVVMGRYEVDRRFFGSEIQRFGRYAANLKTTYFIRYGEYVYVITEPFSYDRIPATDL